MYTVYSIDTDEITFVDEDKLTSLDSYSPDNWYKFFLYLFCVENNSEDMYLTCLQC